MLNFNILMENPLKDETVHSVIRLIVPNKEIPETLDCIWDKVIDYLASFYYIQQDWPDCLHFVDFCSATMQTSSLPDCLLILQKVTFFLNLEGRIDVYEGV